MSNILRVKRNGNYSVISNEPFNDTSLSWKAKGLLAYLLTKPDNWQVNVEQLRKASSNGRDAIYSALKELIAAGYIVREQKRNRKGRTEGYEYIISETKLSFTELPFTENPLTGKPYINKDLELVNTDFSNSGEPPKAKMSLEEKILAIKKQFLNNLISFVKTNPGKYPKAMYVDFASYWLEKGKVHVRYQGEKCFEFGRRLKTWHTNTKQEQLMKYWEIENSSPGLVELLKPLLN